MIRIGKFHSRRHHSAQFVLEGEDTQSSLRLLSLYRYRNKAFSKPDKYYRVRTTEKLEKKLLNRLAKASGD